MKSKELNMIRATKEKKNFATQDLAGSLDQNVYDLIYSDELDLLYKKNAHLLARLSVTGKENTKLYTKLSSLTKERSQLGNRNFVLKSKVLSLKEQISLFARQHRQFNYQSHELKKELEKIQNLSVTPNLQNPKPQEETLYLVKKKEQVYKKQIENLQNLYQKAETEKLAKLEILREDHNSQMADLEANIKKLCNLLRMEKSKTVKPSKIKKINQDLNKKNKELDKKFKELGASFKKEEKFYALTLKEKETLKLKFNKLKEDVGRRSLTKKIIDYKNQHFELIKEKEQLKSGFAEQLDLFTKEQSLLKLQCENLKQALASGKLGFDQAMLSFQKKYAKLYRSKMNLQKVVEERLRDKKDFERNLSLQKDKQTSKLYGDLEVAKERNQELEAQIQTLKTKSEKAFSKEKQQLQEEIKKLEWDKEKRILQIKQVQAQELESLKKDYETRMANVSGSLEAKMQHIQTEMENDLCSEKKRYEVFKEMKTKQFKELQDDITFLQQENHELKTKKFVMEKSLEETQTQLNTYLRSHKRLEDQKEYLKKLWQDLQKQNESKQQQIRSLQELNKSLSLSLNQIKNKEKALDPNKTSKKNLERTQDFLEESQESSTHILADIHFD